ncbi:hypothetical protein [Leptospira noguchii]|uniref:hypothetical protein n=1 Tax=Leptospira noguchii TaxID=28182 RepID=UPI001FB71584|nr:hypothetical protein [Leptospira noguchii]UOG53004.1 hypothetical protein MAL09_01875 [Leptospira noguchii]
MYRSLNSAKRFLRKRLKLSVSLLWALWKLSVSLLWALWKLSVSLLWALEVTQRLASMGARSNSASRFYGRSTGRIWHLRTFE